MEIITLIAAYIVIFLGAWWLAGKLLNPEGGKHNATREAVRRLGKKIGCSDITYYDSLGSAHVYETPDEFSDRMRRITDGIRENTKREERHNHVHSKDHEIEELERKLDLLMSHLGLHEVTTPEKTVLLDHSGYLSQETVCGNYVNHIASEDKPENKRGPYKKHKKNEK